jgi:hypothetical protein
MCVAISMVKCIYSSGSFVDVRLTSKKLFEAIDCEQYPVKYHFTLDHLKYALSFKKLRSHLEASSVTFEDDWKPDSISIDDIRFPQLQRSYTLHFPAGYESLWERNELTTLSGSSEDIQKLLIFVDEEIQSVSLSLVGKMLSDEKNMRGRDTSPHIVVSTPSHVVSEEKDESKIPPRQSKKQRKKLSAQDIESVISALDISEQTELLRGLLEKSP